MSGQPKRQALFGLLSELVSLFESGLHSPDRHIMKVKTVTMANLERINMEVTLGNREQLQFELLIGRIRDHITTMLDNHLDCIAHVGASRDDQATILHADRADNCDIDPVSPFKDHSCFDLR